MKKSKKKKSLQSLDDSYLNAIMPKSAPIEELTTPPTTTGEDILGQDAIKPQTVENQTIQESSADDGIDPVWHEKELIVAPDAMSVTLKIDGGPAISTYQINHALEDFGVTHGIDWQKLAEAEEISKHAGTAEIIVALGTPAETKRTVKFLPVQKVQFESAITWMVDGIQVDFDRLAAIYEEQNIADLDRDAPSVIAVFPGEPLVQIKENTQAKSGKNVFGVETQALEDQVPQMGNNVHLNKETNVLESMIFGYLLIDSETISVLPPVWVTADHHKAYFIDLPQLGPPKLPTSANLRIILIKNKFAEQCKRQQVIDAVCDKLAEGKKLKNRYVLIAEAIPPKPGNDAEIDLCFDEVKKAGKERNDGSFDLRERNAVVSIQENDLVAVKTKATEGIDGCDVFGGKIKAKNGNDLNIITDQGVRVEKQDDKTFYFAKKAGNVKFKNNKLIIADIFKINGDVDYNTGNIDVNSDLLINGSVLPGFSIKAQGNISIEGCIENGATVFAEEDMTVRKGILGEETRAIVLGNLRTDFIQDAEVIVKGEVTIGSYLYNTVLRANGGVSILKGQGRKSGRGVGGITCSSTDINLSTAGNASNLHTVLAIQPNPEFCRQLAKIAERRQLCEQGISKISRTIPIDNFEPDQIKTKLAKLPPTQRETVIKLLTNLNKLIKQQKLLKSKSQELKEEIDQALQESKIRITSEIFRGCEIQIGAKKILLDEDMGPAIFQLKNGKIDH